MLKYAKSIVVDEGNYFVATNATIGTAVTYSLVTNLSSTQAMFVWSNRASNGTPGLAKTTIVDRVRLMLSPGKVAPTGSAAVINYAVVVDSTSRQPTAGHVTLNVANVNIASAQTSICNFMGFTTGQVVTVPLATGTARTVAYGQLASNALVPGDEYVLQFGSHDGSGNYLSTQAGTAGAANLRIAPSRFVTHEGPLIIPPGCWGVIYVWSTAWATNQPCFEYQASWWEV